MYLRDGSAQTSFTCCHTEIEVADQTFYLTRSQYTDTGPTSPSTDPITPGAWQGSHWSANFEVTGMTRPRKNPGASGIRTRDLPLSRRTPYPLGQRGGRTLSSQPTDLLPFPILILVHIVLRVTCWLHGGEDLDTSCTVSTVLQGGQR